jgi:beta-lactamase regulating signal transducer with metallopeptidase domain
MFTARGIVVALAFFSIVYCLLSSLVVLVWRGMNSMGQKPSSSSADFLFGLRLFPFAASVGVACLLTLPSFWLLERRSPDEDVETLILALCSLLVLGAGLFRVRRAQARTRHAISLWLSQAKCSDGKAGSPMTSAASGAPPLILVGFRRPKVMVSETAVALLSEDELRVAVRHELGHMRSRDNFKKVLFSATPFPGMNGLETAWQEAAELAADDAAIANRQEALDLAAALIKLSRSFQPRPGLALATGLYSGSSSISTRVERLVEWRMSGADLRHSWPWPLLVLLTIVVGIASNYDVALVLTHRLTELLVP